MSEDDKDLEGNKRTMFGVQPISLRSDWPFAPEVSLVLTGNSRVLQNMFSTNLSFVRHVKFQKDRNPKRQKLRLFAVLAN